LNASRKRRPSRCPWRTQDRPQHKPTSDRTFYTGQRMKALQIAVLRSGALAWMNLRRAATPGQHKTKQLLKPITRLQLISSKRSHRKRNYSARQRVIIACALLQKLAVSKHT